MAELAQVQLDRAQFIWESRQILHWLLPCICWLTCLIMAAPFGGQKGVAAVSFVSTCSGLMSTPTWWFTRPTWPRWLTATPRPPPPDVPQELQVGLLTQHFEVIIVCICCMQCCGICTLECSDIGNLLYALQIKRAFGYIAIISCTTYGATTIAMVIAECLGPSSSCHLLSLHGSTSSRSVPLARYGVRSDTMLSFWSVVD